MVRCFSLIVQRETHGCASQIKAPQITSYQFPLKEATQISVVMLWLVYCTIGTSHNPPEPPVPGFWEPGRAVVGLLGGRIAVKLAWWTVCVCHSLEALYTASLCRKHTGFVVGVSVELLHTYFIATDSLLF